MNDKVLDKITKLLSLATSSNENEARSATEKANDLLVRHNLTMQDVSKASAANYIEKSIDTKGRRSIESKYVTSVLIEHFFVKVLISYRRVNDCFDPDRKRRQSVTIILGEETNVQVASYVYSFLIRKFKDLWDTYRVTNDAPLTAKQSYYQGLRLGLKEQLDVKRKDIENEIGLVVINDPKLENMVKNMKKVHDKSNINDNNALTNGIEEGKSIRISKGITSSNKYNGYTLEHKK